MRFVLTGRHPTPRAGLVRLIERAGNTVQNAINSRTNYLVRGNIVASAKLREAARYGVTVITYQQLMRMIDPANNRPAPVQAPARTSLVEAEQAAQRAVARHASPISVPVAVTPGVRYV